MWHGDFFCLVFPVMKVSLSNLLEVWIKNKRFFCVLFFLIKILSDVCIYVYHLWNIHFHTYSLAVWEHCYAMIIPNAKLSTGVFWDKQYVYNWNCSGWCLVLEDVGIYIVILFRNESVFLSLLENCSNFLSNCTQNWPSPQCYHQLR